MFNTILASLLVPIEEKNFVYGAGLAGSSVLPALFHCLPNTLSIFTAVLFVEIRGFNIGRGGSIRVIEKAKYNVSLLR